MINGEYIDASAALKRIGGNNEFYKKLLNQLLENDHIGLIKNALDSEDSSKAAREAHSLKGVSANLSLLKLAAVSAALEKEIKDEKDCTGAFNEVKEAYDITVEQIKLYVNQ